jgi:hypothetical protein
LGALRDVAQYRHCNEVAGMSLKHKWSALATLVAVFAVSPQANAVNVLAMSYDKTTDQLVLKIAYRGTNDQHSFTVNWEQCKDYAFVDAKYQVLGNLLDSQPDDPGTSEFTKDLRISLATVECRPVKLTVRTTPGFFRTIVVPAQQD